MKAVTEFPGYTLTKAIQARTTLTTEGKTPEEIQASLGETFKFEGDKLKYFINAIEVASKAADAVKRVVVMSLNEGENPPARSTKFDEHHYVLEFLMLTAPKPQPKEDSKGGRKGRGGGRGGPGGGKGGPKESPWGLSPEEKAAKLAKNKAGASGKPESN